MKKIILVLLVVLLWPVSVLATPHSHLLVGFFAGQFADSDLCQIDQFRISAIAGLEAQPAQKRKTCKIKLVQNEKVSFVINKSKISGEQGISAVKQKMLNVFYQKGMAFDEEKINMQRGNISVVGFRILTRNNRDNIDLRVFFLESHSESYVVFAQSPASQQNILTKLLDKIISATHFPSQAVHSVEGQNIGSLPSVNEMRNKDSNFDSFAAFGLHDGENTKSSNEIYLKNLGVQIKLPKTFVRQKQVKTYGASVAFARSPNFPGVTLSAMGLPVKESTKKLLKKMIKSIKQGGHGVRVRSSYFKVAGRMSAGYTVEKQLEASSHNLQFQQAAFFQHKDVKIMLIMAGPQKQKRKLKQLFKQFLQGVELKELIIPWKSMLHNKYCVDSSYFLRFFDDGRVMESHESNGYDSQSGFMATTGGSHEGRYVQKENKINILWGKTKEICTLSRDGKNLLCSTGAWSTESCSD